MEEIHTRWTIVKVLLCFHCQAEIRITPSSQLQPTTGMLTVPTDGFILFASPKKKKLKHIRILGKSSVTDISRRY